jgi:peroxiredoxin
VFSTPVARSFVRRGSGEVPTATLAPFWRNWSEGWPNGTETAGGVEIYESSQREVLAIFRDVKAELVAAGSFHWSSPRRGPAGVWQLDSHRPGENLFVLPDGSWVVGYGRAGFRLAHRFANSSSSPPRVHLKPGALVVQEIASSGIAMEGPSGRPLPVSPLLYTNEIEGVVVAGYPAPVGADVPTSIDIVYPTNSKASAAAADLARAIAMRDRPRNRPDDLDYFLDRTTVVAEGSALVARGALPYASMAKWMAPPTSCGGFPSVLMNHDFIRSAPPMFRLVSVNGFGPVDLAAYRGRLVLIHFAATWSPACRRSLPKLQGLAAKYRSRGLEVLTVFEDQNGRDVPGFGRAFGATYPILWDNRQLVAASYKLPGIPSTFVVDKQGIVRYVHRDFLECEDVEIEREILPYL